MRMLRPVTLSAIGAGTAVVVTAVLLRDRRTGWLAFGGGDCEEIGADVLAQPVLAVTALALVAAGLVVALVDDRRDPSGGALFALAASGVGLASFAAHATTLEAAATWDAAGAAAVPALVFTRAIGAPSGTHAAVLGAIVAASLIAPATLEGFGLVAAVLAVGAAAATHRRSGRSAGWGIGAVALAGAGLALWALGRTGALWCDPQSTWQPHGAWHMLAAASIVMAHLYLASADGHTPRPGLRST